ncbi:MAG: hypothetical protein F4X40_10265 [Chloroflexi bacterium]|nr:hypothetical protein [Chloroflexota bacterium]
MPQLRQLMRHRFQEWQGQLPEPWHELLGGLDPAYDAIDQGISIDEHQHIYPDNPFSLFSRLAPGQVRVILLGEDPYPDATRASGRAFEPADLRRWQDAGRVPSSRRLAQQLADFRHPQRDYALSRGGWRRLRRALTAVAPHVQLPTPEATFDHWEAQGVLLLNTVLTASENHIAEGDPGRGEHRKAHRSFWARLVQRICRRLADGDQATVFLCWGRRARDFVRTAGITTSTVCPFPVNPCCPATKVLVRDHPRVHSFLDSPNVFREANLALTDLDAGEIQW